MPNKQSFMELTGYAGKPQQWQRAFDLAFDAQQEDIGLLTALLEQVSEKLGIAPENGLYHDVKFWVDSPLLQTESSIPAADQPHDEPTQSDAIERISPNDSSISWHYNTECEIVYSSVKEAVEMYLENCNDKDEAPSEVIEMHAFKHKNVYVTWLALDAVDNLIMRLDEEYGHPEESTETTQDMKDAALAFVETVSAKYHVWQVEAVGSIQIKISDYRSAS